MKDSSCSLRVKSMKPINEFVAIKCKNYSNRKQAQYIKTFHFKSKWIVIIFVLIATWKTANCAPATGGNAEKLCGAKLVDALRFLCGARGIFTPEVSGIGPRSRYRTTLRKPSADITELCCQRGCTVNQLEKYCGKSAPKTMAEMRLLHQRRMARLLPYGRHLRRRGFRPTRT